MGIRRFISLVVCPVLVLSACATVSGSDADDARDLAVEKMSTVPLPDDYVLVDTLVRDMDTNAFTRQSGSVQTDWETTGAPGAATLKRIDLGLLQAGFTRFQPGSSVCQEQFVVLGYARRDLDFTLYFGYAEAVVSITYGFSENSADYDHTSTPHDWLDELPECVDELD